MPVETGSPVRDVTIEDLTVDGFSGSGIYAFNAQDYTVKHVRARNNHGYGLAGFFLSGVRFLHSVATDNAEPGVYIGDSHDAQAVVLGNTSIHNGIGGEGFGFLIRDSSNGQVIGNHSTRNCVGFLFIDHRFGPPAPLSDWTAEANTANGNNGACPASEEFPAFSGTGILLAGTHAVDGDRNHTFSNRPTDRARRSRAGSWSRRAVSLGGARAIPHRQRRLAQRRLPQPTRRHRLGPNRHRQSLQAQPVRALVAILDLRPLTRHPTARRADIVASRCRKTRYRTAASSLAILVAHATEATAAAYASGRLTPPGRATADYRNGRTRGSVTQGRNVRSVATVTRQEEQRHRPPRLTRATRRKQRRRSLRPDGAGVRRCMGMQQRCGSRCRRGVIGCTSAPSGNA